MIVALFTSYGEHSVVDQWDHRWLRLYPNWYSLPQKKKDQLQLSYESSNNKWIWFPSIHPKPDRIGATITPRSHFSDKYIDELIK